MVHGVRVPIEYAPLNANETADEKLFGFYSAETDTITIDEKLEGLALKKTLLHEAIHASLGLSGLAEVLTPQQEEAVCRCVETLGEYFNL